MLTGVSRAPFHEPAELRERAERRAAGAAYDACIISRLIGIDDGLAAAIVAGEFIRHLASSVHFIDGYLTTRAAFAMQQTLNHQIGQSFHCVESRQTGNMWCALRSIVPSWPELWQSRRVFIRDFNIFANQRNVGVEIMRAMHSPSGKIDDIRHDLQTLRNDVAKLAQEMPSLVSDVRDDSLRAARERVGRMKDSIDASLAQFSERSRGAAKAVNDATEDAARGLEEALREHPIAVIALAVGIGCVLGASLRR
jgi:ElaB/YqjD/DUF883 family membrane-anchored ribosome-binding protein